PRRRCALRLLRRGFARDSRWRRAAHSSARRRRGSSHSPARGAPDRTHRGCGLGLPRGLRLGSRGVAQGAGQHRRGRRRLTCARARAGTTVPGMRLALFAAVFAFASVAYADTPAELVQVARGYSGRGQDAKAIPLLQQAIKGDPKNADAHYLLGLSYSRQEKLKDAEAELTQATALDPHNYQAFLLLGMTHDLRNDAAGALAVYEKAIAVDPKQPDAWHEAGSSALLLGKTDVAVKDL